MLPFLLVLVFVGLLFFAGIRFSVYLYHAGSLSIKPLKYIRRVRYARRRSQSASVPDEIVEEPIEETIEEADEQESHVEALVRALDE